MRRYDVELIVMPWRYSSRVPNEFALSTAINKVIVNGIPLNFLTDYSSEEIVNGHATLECDGFIVLGLHQLTDESYEELALTPDDYLEGSNRQCVMLPVASLQITEAPEKVPADNLVIFPTAS